MAVHITIIGVHEFGFPGMFELNELNMCWRKQPMF